MIINSTITIKNTKLPHFTESQIKSEPMLFRSDIYFALENGGPITKAFLISLFKREENIKHNVPNWDEDIVIDSRVHMLMPGMYPCIPGWHHDDVPREREDGQPNYDNPSYKSEHCMAIWGDCSRTQFAIGKQEFNIPKSGIIYQQLNPIVDELIQEGRLLPCVVPERQLVFFNWQSWHRGMEATKHGFRFFIRATRNTKVKPVNEIRYNANVYMKDINHGW